MAQCGKYLLYIVYGYNSNAYKGAGVNRPCTAPCF